ncbi:MAG: DUF6036 family nucleotidyltransferase [Isosphaeraceae bacterium]
MPRTISPAHRDEALRLLDRAGSILDIAREVSRLMRQAEIPGVIIGGIAVVLHGHLRATEDIDVFLDQPLEPMADMLVEAGFQYDKKRREFVRGEVPVHLVTREQVANPPRHAIEIDGITTVSLPDLIEMKLKSGSENILRAQDLADVIGLIRKNRLTGEFARHLTKALRPVYRKLVKAIETEGH